MRDHLPILFAWCEKMNKVLRDIMSEAGYAAPELAGRAQKMADLLIKECAGICKSTAEVEFSPLYSRESDGAMVCYNKIVDRFEYREQLGKPSNPRIVEDLVRLRDELYERAFDFAGVVENSTLAEVVWKINSVLYKGYPRRDES
jgi:hypothetical protein